MSYFYKFGSVAVPFFFILSGFIFFNFYKNTISLKKISFKNFILLRFSRLYPLHILCLFVIFFLQKLYFYYFNDFFAYKDNSIQNFFSHFFLIQEWGINNFFELGNGFNHPAWSISVEFFLYIFFFIVCKFWIKKVFETTIIFFLIILFYISFGKFFINQLTIGLILFFYGGLLYFVSNKLKNLFKFDNNLFLLIYICFNILIFGRSLNDIFLNLQNFIEPLIGNRLMILLFFVKFPLIILNLVILEKLIKKYIHFLKYYIDISYTIYLTHVPIQIILVLLNHFYLNLDYSSNLFFVYYLISVIFFSFFIYVYFELPFKKYIRMKLINEK